MVKDNIYPQHYRQHPHECIEFTERLNFLLGNAFKYVWRYADKNGIEDLKKARWYLERQLNSGPLYSLLEFDVWKDLCGRLGKCRLSDPQRLVLSGILMQGFCEHSAILSDCIVQLSGLIASLESDKAEDDSQCY